LSRSQDHSQPADVGCLLADVVHAMEFRMARTPRCAAFGVCLCCCAQRLGRELFQRRPQVCGAMKLHLIGVNHKTAPVEVRERLAIPEWRLEEATRRLLEEHGVSECVVFSTCNRVELVTCSDDGADLRGFFREYLLTDITALRDYLYEYTDGDVVRHLFRVAASLDSMIVGEPQILGQVKH